MSWVDCQLKDVIGLAYGKSLPERNRKEGDVPVYGSGGIGGYHNIHLVEGPGVVVGRKGTVGSVYFEKNDFFPIDTVYFVRPNEEKISLEYAYYLLKSLPLASLNSDAAVPGLNRDRAYALQVKVPEPNQQNRIVGFLSQYDDLIENNRRRIQLLEQAARLLYKEWFVHFRFPGHEHVKLRDGVPEGWKRKTLGDLCQEIRESVLPEALEPDTPYIGLEHMPRRSISLSEWSMAEQVISSKHRFREGEILFGKIRPYFHKVGIAFVDGISSSDAIVIRPLEEKLRGLVLMTVSSDEFVALTAQTMKEGSKMPRADWKQMQQYVVPLPANGLLSSFDSVIRPIVEQLKTLSLTNQKLRAARDLLLPRLMNGEIKV
jgi:type I restriction enzyme S subunit